MVTISTNMAGRGTDIVLGEGVVELGGLHIIGTERHESRRIDNQLRGRAARQGDPGSTRFYTSLEDDLMRLFGSGRVSGMMERLGLDEDTPIEHKLITRALENAQKKVEQYHFGMRKQVLEYDDVMNKQRETIYALRRRILEGKDLQEKVYEMIGQVIDNLVLSHLPEKINPEEWDWDGLIQAVNEIIPVLGLERLKELTKPAAVKEELEKIIRQAYADREQALGAAAMREVERLVMLRVIDTAWIEQLHNMDVLQDGIGLRGVGGRDPLVEYKIEGYGMFNEMMLGVRQQVVSMILKVQLAGEEEIKPKARVVSYGAPERGGRPAPVKAAVQIGRNDPCPCGSGKKYKKCCLKS
jgi:preprotein translocase subunit SecA